MIWNFAMLALCIACVVACICRLNILGLRHKWSVSVFHVGLLVLSASAARNAWNGALDLQDYASAAACVCWFVVSYRSWKTGVPDHYRRSNASAR